MSLLPESVKKYLENENLYEGSLAFCKKTSVFLQEIQDPFFAFLDLNEERKISDLCDVSLVQDSFLFRAKRRAHLISSYLISEKGKLSLEKLSELLQFWEKEGNIFYPTGYNDETIYLHVLKVLQKMLKDKALQQKLQSFSVPLCHKGAEELIREVLDLSEEIVLTDAHVRRAVLSATFMILRQSIGSCFATAPAILIHEEQPGVFLDDLFSLLVKGKLKRVINGVEYIVPFVVNWGSSDAKKNLSALSDVFSQKKHLIARSPGLIFALEKVGIIEKNLSWEEKARVLERKIEEISVNFQTIEELLRYLIAKHFGCSFREMQHFEQKQFVSLKKDFSYLEEKELYLFQLEKAKRAFRSFVDHGLVKSWEYTLASFAEAKTDFTQWNLYCSLGMHPQEDKGIGQLIFQTLDGFLQENKKKYEESQRDCEAAFDQLRSVEALLRRATKESEVRRLQAEHQMKSYHFQSCLDLRDHFYKKASRYGNLFSYFSDEFQKKFPEFFQEIYDTHLEETASSLFEDSPAGFRLAYKHGRMDSTLWTMIYTKEQYMAALSDFFITIEPQIALLLKEDFEKEVLAEIITKLIFHVKTEEFLQSAYLRLQQKRDLMQKGISTQSPWFYISGGSMFSFLKIYGKRQAEIAVETKQIESPLDLLIFIADTLKSLPPKITKAFDKDPSQAMLMYSPTHAFLLLPEKPFLQKIWKDSGFTYTFIRDRYILPAKEFYDRVSLNAFEQKYLLEVFSEQLPIDKAHYVANSATVSFSLTLPQFCQMMLDTLQSAFSMPFVPSFFEDHVDSFLRSALPLTQGKDWKNHVRLLLEDLDSSSLEEVLAHLPNEWSSYVDAKSLLELAKTCYMLSSKKVQFSLDLHQTVHAKARKHHLSAPEALLFADSNWSGFYFAFVLGCKAPDLELWRVNKTGNGVPMGAWKNLFSAKEPQRWGICTEPTEYVYG